MPAGKASPFVDLCVDLAKAGKCFERDEADLCLKVAEAGKQFLENKLQGFIRGTAGKPLLVSYMSDGTPMLLRKRVHQRAGPNLTIVREGGSGVELLMQQVFVKRLASNGTPEVRCLLRDPRPMDGKTTLHCFSAMEEMMPMAREMQHAGLVISHHYGFDRALFSALSRLARQRHEAHQPSDAVLSQVPHPDLLPLTDWVVTTGCGNHDSQNALKWASSELLEDPVASMKNLFVVFEALRNSFLDLHKALRQWLVVCVDYDPSPYDRMDAKEFWGALIMDDGVLDLLVDLNPRWDPGNSALYINEEWKGKSELLETLSEWCSMLFVSGNSPSRGGRRWGWHPERWWPRWAWDSRGCSSMSAGRPRLRSTTYMV